jgi:tetratricopeptide (TPR) repeat protein
LRHLAIVLAIQITGGAASVFSGPGRTTTAGGQNSYRSLKILKSIRKVRNSQNNSAPANQKQFDWHATPVRNRLSSAFDETKRGITKVLTIEPRIIHVADATRLSDEVDEPSAAVHLANARLQKQRKRFDLASRSYSRVLDQEPDHLQALVEFGRMLDQQNRFNEAIVYYRQACKAYPKQASLLNDLALCYARGGSFPASFATFSEAIKLDPGNPLYRNNVAVALVAQNQSGAALDHLVAAHGPAIGHYNLAFLLHQRGNSDLARKHLQTALMHDS